MKIMIDKILLYILALEVICALFIGCFYYDLYNSTLDGTTGFDQHGNMVTTPVQSWSVDLVRVIQAD